MTAPREVVPLNDLRRAYRADASVLDGMVSEVLQSGWYSLGENVERFEREFAEYIGTAHCIGVASGTDALELCLRAVGCGPGDEVVTAANAGAYATLAALRLGASPRFADVAEATLTLSAESVAASLTRASKAVVVTHLYGQVADMEPLVALCRARGLALVEDCAQSAGAQRGGTKAGSFGDVAAFSFYPTKNLGAVGDGGAVTTDDDEIAGAVRSLRQYGWSERYRVDRPGGLNSRLDELQAAVLRARLPKLDARNERRRSIARRYADAVPAEVGRLLGSAEPDFVGHLAVLCCSDRPRTQARLSAAGIATGVHYPIPDHRQPALLHRDVPVRLPVTERAAEKVLTIPLFPELREDEITRVLHVLSGG